MYELEHFETKMEYFHIIHVSLQHLSSSAGLEI
jgi:hypothetical protein